MREKWRHSQKNQSGGVCYHETCPTKTTNGSPPDWNERMLVSNSMPYEVKKKKKSLVKVNAWA